MCFIKILRPVSSRLPWMDAAHIPRKSVAVSITKKWEFFCSKSPVSPKVFLRAITQNYQNKEDTILSYELVQTWFWISDGNLSSRSGSMATEHKALFTARPSLCLKSTKSCLEQFYFYISFYDWLGHSAVRGLNLLFFFKVNVKVTKRFCSTVFFSFILKLTNRLLCLI